MVHKFLVCITIQSGMRGNFVRGTLQIWDKKQRRTLHRSASTTGWGFVKIIILSLAQRQFSLYCYTARKVYFKLKLACVCSEKYQSHRTDVLPEARRNKSINFRNRRSLWTHDSWQIACRTGGLGQRGPRDTRAGARSTLFWLGFALVLELRARPRVSRWPL